MCNYKHSQKRKDRIDKLNIVWVVRRSNLKIFKNSFYSDFVLQSIIKIVGTVLGMAGGWGDLSESGKKTLFDMYDNAHNRTYAFIRQV